MHLRQDAEGKGTRTKSLRSILLKISSRKLEPVLVDNQKRVERKEGVVKSGPVLSL